MHTLKLLLAATLFVCLACSKSQSAITTGSVDLNPDPIQFGTNGPIYAMAQTATDWYIGGSFDVVKRFQLSGFVSLTTAGAVDTTCNYTSGFDGSVYAIAATSTAIYLGGNFTSYKDQPAFRIAKLNRSDCSLDTTFHPANSVGFDASVSALLITNGALYVGGSFETYRGVADSAFSIAKLDLLSGSLDTTFSPPGAGLNGFDNLVLAFATSGTSLYVVGDFHEYRGVANSAHALAKLDLDNGAIDIGFSPPGATSNGFSAYASSVAVHGTSLYVGGNFTAYQGIANSANRLAKLDLDDGDIDVTFSPPGASTNGFDSIVETILVANGALYVGGWFNSYRGVANSANNIAKLDLSSGTLDPIFGAAGATTNGFDGGVNRMATDGSSLYLVGNIYTYYKTNDETLQSIAKLNLTSGTVDTTFQQSGHTNKGFSYAPVTIIFDSNRLIVGGVDSYGGYLANNIAKFNKTTGEVDTTFSPQSGANGFSNAVESMIVMGDRLLVGGDFWKYRDVVTPYSAFLDSITGALIE